jgi:hypothetical protein
MIGEATLVEISKSLESTTNTVAAEKVRMM